MDAVSRRSGKPGRDCPLCPRLVAFRQDWRAREPGWFNAPVPSFGPLDARMLIVGLAPGLQGANRTGRPFTGDHAGILLYDTLRRFGFARGEYQARPDDGFALIDARITNSVRCVPPENKPTPAEARTCRRFLEGEIRSLTRLKAILALGRVAHDAVAAAVGGRPSAFRFAHGGVHALPNGLRLIDSYHCSRYNTQTGVLTEEMFRQAVATAQSCLSPAARRSRG